MTKLADKVENALNETRMLVLGTQVLIGFAFQAVFQPLFDRLPDSLHALKLIDLSLLVAALVLLLTPTAYHQIVEGGNDSERLADFAGRFAAMALFPFALGLGLDIFLASSTVLGFSAAVPAGIGATLFALTGWYGIEWLWRLRHPHTSRRKETAQMGNGTDLDNKIKQALTEARVVLPGAQALLGFQLVVMLSDSFAKLAQPSQYVHLLSLGMIAVTIILLMAPAAFHRIVEDGEDTERMHRFTSAMVLIALVPLGLGVAGDVYVVSDKVLQSSAFALGLAATCLIASYGVWFGLTLAIRRHTTQRPSPAEQAHVAGSNVRAVR
ncbi:MAG TPA: DUF6328 family protein [Chloroflexota bacterium]|jgi:hypothetical protein|nr:DUF6328 family protein [Chloroflexota bacterium]